ncbi:MAG: hypothetical protein RL272_370 [Candidatus Parcubacteria bacterium]|jgi:hypothetical protein
MTRDRLLERARRSHRLAVLHRGLRDVSGEVAAVRESLTAAGSQPAAIGVTEAELAELVRSGFLAEARITFELAADSGSTPSERDFLFTDLVALIAKALAVETPAASAPPQEAPIGDDEAAKLLAEHDPGKGLVPWEVARNSDAFAEFSDADIDALNFDAIEPAPPVVGADPLPEDDPGPFIELSLEDINEDPVVTIERISTAPESLMPAAPSAEPAMSPEAMRMAVRFFGEEDAADLGLIPGSAGPPIPLTDVIRQGAIAPPLPRKKEEGAAADADA